MIYVCLINYWWIYLLIAWISCHMHYIGIYLDNGQISIKNQNSLGIGHKKIGDFNWKGQWEDHKMRKCTKIEKSKRWLHWLGGRSVRWDLGFLKDSHASVSTPFSSISLGFLWFWLIETDLSAFWTDWSLLDWILRRLEARVSDLGRLLFLLTA